MNHQFQITFLAIHLFLFCSTGKGSQVSHLDSDPTNSEPNIGEITASENSEISDKILCEKALINLADAVAPEALTIKQNIRALLDRIEIENLESNGRLSSHAQSQRSLEIFQQFQLGFRAIYDFSHDPQTYAQRILFNGGFVKTNTQPIPTHNRHVLALNTWSDNESFNIASCRHHFGAQAWEDFQNSMVGKANAYLEMIENRRNFATEMQELHHNFYTPKDWNSNNSADLENNVLSCLELIPNLKSDYIDTLPPQIMGTDRKLRQFSAYSPQGEKERIFIVETPEGPFIGKGPEAETQNDHSQSYRYLRNADQGFFIPLSNSPTESVEQAIGFYQDLPTFFEKANRQSSEGRLLSNSEYELPEIIDLEEINDLSVLTPVLKDLVPALEEHWLGFHHSLEPEAARRYLSAGVIRDGTLTSDEIRHFIETRARFQEVVDTCYSTPGLETEKQILQRYLDNFMERLHPMDWRLWKSIEVIEPYLDQVPTETLFNDIEPFMDDAMKYRYQLRTIMNG